MRFVRKFLGQKFLGFISLRALFMTHKELWLSVLKRLQPTIAKVKFVTWFQNTLILERNANTVVLGVPTTFAYDNLKMKYDLKIKQALVEVDNEITDVEYKVCSRLQEKDNHEALNVKNIVAEKEEKKVRKVRNLDEINVQKGDYEEKIVSKMLNGSFGLDNFVVGRENRLPHAVCTAVSDAPGGVYNPLFIYGGVGLGKTHLLQATGNAILSNFPDKIVKYVTAEKFVNEVIAAIQTRKMDRFKSQYRNVDVFLVDDVQFFGNKESSQNEFFHTFNDLYDRNKQIVITADRPPSELANIDQRLSSRFAMGMVVELSAPDFETRFAILRQKCKEFQVIIDPEVLQFIATNVQSSVRELMGVLRQAVAESHIGNKVVTIRMVAEIIRRLHKAQEIIGYDIEAKRAQMVPRIPEDVMKLVADYFKLSVDHLLSNDRHKEVIIPRQICMYLIKMELGCSYEKIGEAFGGRNHTTVMHACNKMAKSLRKDVRMVRDINAIKSEMGL